MNHITRAVFFCLVLTTSAQADETTPPKVQPDSAMQEGVSNPMQQADGINMVEAIRSAIEKDNSVSTYAQSINIVPEGNVLVLRGAVVSSFEKLAIEKAAMDAAGQDNVRSELQVVK